MNQSHILFFEGMQISKKHHDWESYASVDSRWSTESSLTFFTYLSSFARKRVWASLHNFGGLLVLDPESKDMYHCHSYHFSEMYKPPVNEPIGSYQIQHLKLFLSHDPEFSCRALIIIWQLFTGMEVFEWEQSSSNTSNRIMLDFL